eukprot:CAMPEP_0181186886 /NCGR_PEP_ID=MMETSP1096-20121128/10272_1 /TAXON_ID=156174 ORGANISM="Chrysochromulina ericina, Strain CCMP281" /NCGR_SAMPLE_ID=MMETSP1096 /ASSEMBLY_ACC=CAM_ASM_000453 /LENGTH=51 /DNA_ID=CAMNT_0023275811 /DNA_START=285 /DNA_END=440 /DNA_ORIENTATION=-
MTMCGPEAKPTTCHDLGILDSLWCSSSEEQSDNKRSAQVRTAWQAFGADLD